MGSTTTALDVTHGTPDLGDFSKEPAMRRQFSGDFLQSTRYGWSRTTQPRSDAPCAKSNCYPEEVIKSDSFRQKGCYPMALLFLFLC
jgi:hypothetical protein